MRQRRENGISNYMKISLDRVDIKIESQDVGIEDYLICTYLISLGTFSIFVSITQMKERK